MPTSPSRSVAPSAVPEPQRLRGPRTDAFLDSSAFAQSVRRHVQTLSSDAMRGRGSATEDEARTAEYLASELKKAGIQPALPGGFIQELHFRIDPAVARSDPALAAVVKDGRLTTRNVLGMIPGTDPEQKAEVILLSAHMDHLGKAPFPQQGDDIFNGADDDASGVTAVLDLAAELAKGPPPKRTIMFAFYGAEEIGRYGARAFLQRPPVPLKSIVTNIEFEMIGRKDPAVPDNTLWLTGFERSDLGAALASHGASVVADPRPSERFFYRSDNTILAQEGIVAQTVSSYGMHGDYHGLGDDFEHLDLPHLTQVIGSFVAPVRWLANSRFAPRWNPGGQPT
jgi:hypothetical protein